ncbi:MAG: UDP-N-acetylmuramate dehydrogenase [Actinobacteria bacterium]|nr:UDP-N-acetylmuramate dehydrogenase [Actinomycetota bacterium]
MRVRNVGAGGGAWAEVAARLKGRFLGSMIEGAMLSEYTTFRIGGPADLMVFPKGIGDLGRLLEAIAETGCPWMVMGNGSNLLFSDRGFRGVVVVLGRGFNRVKKNNKCEVYVESGCSINRFLSWAEEVELGGLEDLAGIPGTMGGAARMNAGAMGTCIGDRVLELSVMGESGGEVQHLALDRDKAGFGYRRSGVKDREIIYIVKLELYKKDRKEIRARKEHVLEWRRRHQPLEYPSAGSVFKNPTGISAGELIERCGLKGARSGMAQISEKHANFIVNLGGASADDVLSLIRRVKEEVQGREGIELEEEIKIVGEVLEA